MADHAPYQVYVMDLSYFSGKFESYLRYKEIPYTRIPVNHDQLHGLYLHTGTMKVPAVHTSDGLWLKDTTPMIDWFEQQHPEASITPEDPALSFLAYLLEDFGDEWLWRPAMWWRWEPKISRVSLGQRVAREVLPDFPAPAWLMSLYFAWRQRRTWLWGDGMDRSNSHQVRDQYTTQLHALQAILDRQPFLLGSHPSRADLGFFGPFFRHFSHDPESSELMRQEGPAVYEWTARFWNAKSSRFSARPEWSWPRTEEWQPIWSELCGRYLPYLTQNAVAWRAGRRRFDYEAGDLRFSGTVTTPYRVWCRQVLLRRWKQLAPQDQVRVLEVLEPYGGLEPLQLELDIDSGLDEDLKIPFPPRPRPPWLRRWWTWLFGTARNSPPPT